MHSEQRRNRHDIVPFLVIAGVAFHSEVIGVFINFSCPAGCRASPDDGAVVILCITKSFGYLSNCIYASNQCGCYADGSLALGYIYTR